MPQQPKYRLLPLHPHHPSPFSDQALTNPPAHIIYPCALQTPSHTQPRSAPSSDIPWSMHLLLSLDSNSTRRNGSIMSTICPFFPPSRASLSSIWCWRNSEYMLLICSPECFAPSFDSKSKVVLQLFLNLCCFHNVVR
jgi:hypothetical protein